MMSWNAGRKRDWFIEFAAIGLVVIDLNKFIVVVLSLGGLTLTTRPERGEENTERELSYPTPDSDLF